NIGATILIGSLLTGCGADFLDERDPQYVGFEHIKDLASLTSASIGVYNNFFDANYYGRTFVVTPELIGDNSILSRRDGVRYATHDNFTITNGDGYVLAA